MTTTQTEYRFTAEITGKGKTPGGTPYLQFGWKLPGAQYEFQLLLGREPETYAGWNPGDVATAVITQGGLKTGKDGQYTTDFFWNLNTIEDGEGQPFTSSPAAPPRSNGSSPRTPDPTDMAFPQVEGIVRGHVENIAVQLYIASFPHDVEWNADVDLKNIRQLRDRVYHELTNQPITPPHYCYFHEHPRIQGKTGAWGHRQEDGFCIEDASGIFTSPEAGPPKEFNEPAPQRGKAKAPQDGPPPLAASDLEAEDIPF